jgi:hypothetical protein
VSAFQHEAGDASERFTSQSLTCGFALANPFAVRNAIPATRLLIPLRLQAHQRLGWHAVARASIAATFATSNQLQG